MLNKPATPLPWFFDGRNIQANIDDELVNVLSAIGPSSLNIPRNKADAEFVTELANKYPAYKELLLAAKQALQVFDGALPFNQSGLTIARLKKAIEAVTA